MSLTLSPIFLTRAQALFFCLLVLTFLGPLNVQCMYNILLIVDWRKKRALYFGIPELDLNMSPGEEIV